MGFFRLLQVGFFGLGGNSRKALAADRIEGSITIAPVRKGGMERPGQCWPRFMLLSVRKLYLDPTLILSNRTHKSHEDEPSEYFSPPHFRWRLDWISVRRMLRMQCSAEIQAPADMRFFCLTQIGLFGFGSNKRKALAADRIDGSITIASVREEGTGRSGHG